MIALTVALATFLSYCVQPSSAPIQSGSPSVLLRQAEPEDRGAAEPGITVTRRLEVVNTGTTDRRLTVSNKSCGCLDITVEPGTIQPGQSAIITMRVVAIVAGSPQVQAAEITVAPLGEVPSGSKSEMFTVRLGYTPLVDYVITAPNGPVVDVRGAPTLLSVVLRAPAGKRLPALTLDTSPPRQLQIVSTRPSADQRELLIQCSALENYDEAAGWLVLRQEGKPARNVRLEVKRRDRLRASTSVFVKVGNGLTTPLLDQGGQSAAPLRADRLSVACEPAASGLSVEVVRLSQGSDLALRIVCGDHPGQSGVFVLRDETGGLLATIPWTSEAPEPPAAPSGQHHLGPV